MATNTKKTDKPLKTDETSSATRKTYPVRLRTELQNKLEEESEHLIQEGYQVQEASGVELIRRLVDARYGFFGLPPEQASLITVAGEIPVVNIPAWVAAIGVKADELYGKMLEFNAANAPKAPAAMAPADDGKPVKVEEAASADEIQSPGSEGSASRPPPSLAVAVSATMS